MPPQAQGGNLITRRRLFLSAVAATVGAGSYAKWGEPNWLRVANLDIHLPGWPREASGLRIGQISDLHCDTAADATRTAHAARLLMAQKPDIVFVTGDYLSSHPVTPKATTCIRALAPVLRTPRGVFAILGNHDWWSGGADEISWRLRRAGFCMLRNQAVPLPGVRHTWIVGLDDCFDGHDDIEQALRHVPEKAVKLLLAHEPDYADSAPSGFSLQLSGHSHGGQVRIPGLPPPDLPYLGRKYYEGLRQSPNHLVYTTRGVGMVRPKIRLFCPPEVALLRIFPQA